MYRWILNCFRAEAKHLENMVGHVFALVFFYACQLVFFEVVGAIFAGAGLSQMWFFQLLISYISISLIVSVFAASIEGFFKCLAKGGMDPLMVKPVSIWVVLLFRECRPSYVIVLVCTWLFMGLYIEAEYIERSSMNLGVWVLSVFFGVAANISFLIIMNSFTFLGQRELPVDYIHSELSYFALVPISILSSGVSGFLMLFFPMLVCASYSATVMSSGVSISFLFFAGVVMIHVLFSIALFRWLAFRFDGFGG